MSWYVLEVTLCYVFGTINFLILALVYTAIALGVGWLRGADDELNTLFSGASAGMLYYASGQ